jgi:hypothetical protein
MIKPIPTDKEKEKKKIFIVLNAAVQKQMKTAHT